MVAELDADGGVSREKPGEGRCLASLTGPRQAGNGLSGSEDGKALLPCLLSGLMAVRGGEWGADFGTEGFDGAGAVATDFSTLMWLWRAPTKGRLSDGLPPETEMSAAREDAACVSPGFCELWTTSGRRKSCQDLPGQKRSSTDVSTKIVSTFLSRFEDL